MNEEILKRLEKIEARAARATPGPWVYGESEREQWVKAGDKLVVYLEYYGKPNPEVYQQTKHDFEFVARTREDVPWLCRVVRELIAQNAVMRGALERIETLPWEAYSQKNGSMFGDGDWLRVRLQQGEKALKQAREVLRSDTGRALLNRLRHLEAVADAARKVWDAASDEVKEDMWFEMPPDWEGWEELEKALAALEEANDEPRDLKAS